MQLLRQLFSLELSVDPGAVMQLSKQFSLTFDMRNLALAMFIWLANSVCMRWRIWLEEELEAELLEKIGLEVEEEEEGLFGGVELPSQKPMVL